MTQVTLLNKLERKLTSFGISVRPRQTSRGSITLPVKYQGNGFGATFSCIGGRPTESWWGNWSPTAMKRAKEHFDAFLAVDSF